MRWRYTLFDTVLGRCAIAWTDEDRVTSIRLPDESAERTVASLAAAAPDELVPAAPPRAITRVIEGVVALMDGSNLTDDLAWVHLDMDQVSDFQRAVYRITRRIPPGHTRTYGEIAAEMKLPGSARAVGRALGENPFPPVVPCHRVTAAGGRTGGFSAGGGVQTKMRLLAIEQSELGLW